MDGLALHPAERQRDFIRELCIALEHRWNPEALFLIYTAYFDESASHGPSPNLVLAAFLGHGRQWELFGRRLRGLQREYGFTVFHAKEFKSGSGEFRGWSPEKKRKLISDLTDLVRDQLTEGLAVALTRERYLSEYRAPPVPKGMNLDSQYGLCFRACLSQLADTVLALGPKHRLHVVIEDGHVNVGDCTRIFAEAIDHLEERGINVLGTITISQKKRSPPLMVADFLAHTVFMAGIPALADPSTSEYATGLKPGASSKVPIKRKTVSYIELLPDALRDLKRDWEEHRRRKAEAWRARRDAKRASSSEKGRPS